MLQQEYTRFLDAVDTVCANCILGNEQDCVICPVRKTCEHFAETIKA